ncbi:hypothetical protein WN55_01267 [Dufourea novaeangliae]|uniref:Uncharacterized protein n=1 Tax=Dufourea novaeangliae TaxID=178035 RepID=A0A154NWF7_DUFNO|nr:hypothetical protein WN55_01267 [Dufourea novaeangliae]
MAQNCCCRLDNPKLVASIPRLNSRETLASAGLLNVSVRWGSDKIKSKLANYVETRRFA